MPARIARHGDAETFLRRARPWLLQTEPENNLILGLADHARTAADAVYVATVEQDGAVVGCALRMPPRKLVLTRMPPGAVPALVMDVAACFPELPAVFGPPAAAREFGRLWSERHGCTARDGMEQRLYVLDRVRFPDPPPPGELKLATQHEVGLVTSWIACFSAEAAVAVPTTREHVARRIEQGEIALWWDSQPRAMAGYSGRSPNGVRIGHVYTPPEWRGRGYASACVAALSRRALDADARFCCLYTDLSNPVSNAIYQRIGYRPAADCVDIVFQPAS